MSERFFIIKQKNDKFSFETFIVVDLVTGVQYLWASSGYGGGLTAMLDQEGKPLLYQGPTEFEG